MADQSITRDMSHSLKTNTFTRKGYTFGGWAKTPSGAVAYKDGDIVRNLASANKTCTFYAKWTANHSSGFVEVAELAGVNGSCVNSQLSTNHILAKEAPFPTNMSPNRTSPRIRQGTFHHGTPEGIHGHPSRPLRLQVEGGGGKGSYFGASLSAPLGWFDFVLEAEKSSLSFHCVEEVSWGKDSFGNKIYSGYLDTISDFRARGIALLEVNPFRNSFFAPYAGVGVGYLSSNYTFHFDGDWNSDYYDWEISESTESLCLEVGARFDLGKVFLDLGCLNISNFKLLELYGDFGCFVSQMIQCHLIARKIDGVDNSSKKVSRCEFSFSLIGVGISYDF